MRRKEQPGSVYWLHDPTTPGEVRELAGSEARVVWADDPPGAEGRWYKCSELRQSNGASRRLNPSAVPAPMIQDLEFITRIDPATNSLAMERDADFRGDDDPGPEVTSAADIYDLYQDMGTLDQEHIVVGLLDVRLCVLGWTNAHKGAIDNVAASARDMLKAAIMCNAAKYIYMLHNHPSGNPEPSDADAELTEAIERLAGEYEIGLFDHVIIGRPGAGHDPYFSFREAGLLADLEEDDA